MCSAGSSSSSSNDLGVFLIMSDSGYMAVHDGDNNTSVNFQAWSGLNSGSVKDIAYGNNKFVKYFFLILQIGRVLQRLVRG